MKFYIVEDTAPGVMRNGIMLVKANNKKEAFGIMWETLGYDNQEYAIQKGYRKHYKSDFGIYEVEQYIALFGNSNNLAVIR